MHNLKTNTIALIVLFLALIPMREYASEMNNQDIIMAPVFAQWMVGNTNVNLPSLLDYAETVKESHPRVYAVIQSRKIQKDSLEKILAVQALIKKPGLTYLKGGKYQEKEKKARMLYQQACEITAKHLPE